MNTEDDCAQGNVYRIHTDGQYLLSSEAVVWLRRLASYRAGLDSRPDKSMWDLWWAGWHWDWSFPRYLILPCQYNSDVAILFTSATPWMTPVSVVLLWCLKDLFRPNVSSPIFNVSLSKNESIYPVSTHMFLTQLSHVVLVLLFIHCTADSNQLFRC